MVFSRTLKIQTAYDAKVIPVIQRYYNLMLAKAEIDSKEDVDAVYARGPVYDIAEKYNPGDRDYCNQVMQVYDNVIELFYPDIEEYSSIKDVYASTNDTTDNT